MKDLTPVGPNLQAALPLACHCLLPGKEASLCNRMSRLELFWAQAGRCLRHFKSLSSFN